MSKLEFSCNRSQILEAVSICSRAVSVKSNIPALQGLLLESFNNQLRISSYDLEMGMKTQIEGTSDAEGSVVFPAKIFGDILRRMTDDIVNISVDEKNTANIKCGEAESSVSCIDPDEFPEMPSVNKEKSLIIGSEIFKSMIRQTIFCVAQNDSRPINTGICFETEKNLLRLTALDGFRLAVRQENISCDENIKFVVAGKAMNEILKLLNDEGDVEISIGNRHILFIIDGYSIVTRLMDGEFMDFRKAVSNEFSTSVTIQTKKLLNSIELASLIITEKIRTPIRCTFKDNICDIKCQTSVGKVHDKVECNLSGNDVEIGVNNRYMIDALSASDLDMVLIEMNGPLSPIKIKPLEGDSFLFIIMPMRIKDEL